MLQARAALAGLQAAASASAQATSYTTGRARAALNKVLKSGEFQTGWWAKQQEHFQEMLARWLRRILRHFPRTSGRWQLNHNLWRDIGIVVLVLGGIALVYLIVVLLLRRERPAARSEEEATPLARPKVVLPHAVWLEQAARHAQAGDYVLGVRALHMAALMKLDAAGLVRYDHAYTDRRFVRLLQARDHPELARVLGLLNQLFALLWYGRQPARVQEISGPTSSFTRWSEGARNETSPARSGWLVGITVVMLVIAGVMTTSNAALEQQSRPSRSSYSTSPGGFRALYLMLDQLGYRVSCRRRPFAEELPDGLFVIAEPSEEAPMVPSEWDRLYRRWRPAIPCSSPLSTCAPAAIRSGIGGPSGSRRPRPLRASGTAHLPGKKRLGPAPARPHSSLFRAFGLRPSLRCMAGSWGPPPCRSLPIRKARSLPARPSARDV